MAIQPFDRSAPAVLDANLLRKFRKSTSTSKEHFYTVLLGLEPPETSDLIKMLQAGLPYSAWTTLIRFVHISQESLLRLTQIPKRTLYYRKQAGKFKSLESERLVRVARVFGELMRFYDGDLEGALRWIYKPQRALDGKTPFEMMVTETGAREVEELILRRAYGVIA